jgi:hypothetical protein
MTNKEIIDKHLKEFHEVQGLQVPIELNSYLHRMIEEALRIHDVVSVRVNEVKLICEHRHGVESCAYKYKDVYTCKHLRNCEMCGN